jgi:hypothetical protein
MLSLDAESFISDRTQATFQLLVASGADLGGLLALISCAYADGGHYVLDRLHEKMGADAPAA